MKIIDTPTLTETQTEEAARLVSVCRAHDGIRLTYPSEETGGGSRHYLFYEDGGTLAAILAMLPLDGQTAECCAFTHPAHRRQGCFSRLLAAAMEQFEEYDILFGITDACHPAARVLSALGAELVSREHQMEILLPQGLVSASSGAGQDLPSHAGLTLISQDYPEDCDRDTISTVDTASTIDTASTTDTASTIDTATTIDTASTTDTTSTVDTATTIAHAAMPPTTAWTLAQDGFPIGRCLITPVSADCACLHHLEIKESLRHNGYGSDFLSLLLPRIAASGTSKLILQVSGDNPAAIALYKKTGFGITETLSFYCY